MKDDERRFFRIAVDRVIDRSQKRISLDDILTMCAGIEGLAELNEDSAVGSDQINAVAEAAQKTAQEAGISMDRLRGVLDLLRHQSLPRRLKLLGRGLESMFGKAEIDLAGC